MVKLIRTLAVVVGIVEVAAYCVFPLGGLAAIANGPLCWHIWRTTSNA